MKNDLDQPHDSTEDWLRHILGGHRPEAPADAWQRLAPQLPQRRRRRVFVFWLSGAAVGAAVVAAFFWFLKSAAPPVASPVGVEDGQPVAQAESAVLPKKLEKKEAAIPAQKLAATTAEPFSKQRFSAKNSPQLRLGLPENAPLAAPVGVVFLKKENAAGLNFSEKTAPPQAKISLEKLPSSSAVPLLLAEKSLPATQLPLAPVLSKKTQNPRFWLEIAAAPAFFMQKNTGEAPSGLAFPEMHTGTGNGWQAGVSLAAEPLKNWRVALGIQRLQQTHEAAHEATLRLMDGVCLNPNYAGLKEYQFQYALVSGGEQNDLTLRLQQQDIGSTMPADEPFTLDMKTIHRATAWRLPLTIERRFGTGKWRGFVRGGASMDFSEKSKIELTHFTEACEDLCFQGNHLPAIQASAASKATLGWLAGAGIERQISRRAALRLEPFAAGQKGAMQGGLSLGLLLSN